MKRTLFGRISSLVAAVVVTASSPALIIGINTPANSFATLGFNDTLSLDPLLLPGTTNLALTTSPWNGATWTLPLTTDPVTGDFAQGSVTASFVPASNTYAVSLGGIVLSQAVNNTGQAILDVDFIVEFQLDGAGLPLQATLYPNFVVTGTIQNIAGSFASVAGRIDYWGVNTAGTIGVLETVNYNTTWTTPGSFTATAFGVPVNGFTPLLVGNTTLTLDGHIRFVVDPALINVESVQVPEPAAALLWLAGGLLAWRRRRLQP